MSAQPLLDIQNIVFHYRPGKPVLAGAAMTVPAGARVVVVGPNGAGKSTLFLHINAILRPLAGELRYQGRPYSYSRSFLHMLRQKVGLVFQDPDTQLFAGNVLEDVMFGPLNGGLSPGEAQAEAEAALDAVGMLGAQAEPVHFLSQGQKKRVAVAGVLAMHPEVLVLDEPTAGLDYPGLVNLRRVLDMLHRRGKTLVVATHDIDWAWEWADLAYVLDGGKIVAGGPPAAILNRPDHAELGFARPILGEIYSELNSRHLLQSPQDAPPPRTCAQLAGLLAKTLPK